MDKRLDALEIKTAWLEDTVEQLGRVLTAQGAELAALKAALARLQRRLEGEEPEIRGIEPPPHY